MEDIRLFSYKMTHDTGFAPNPFKGFLTLANCKPKIRKYRQPKEWVAGFTSVGLNGDSVGREKLVYLMEITNKVDYYEYWTNPNYECKKPKSGYVTIENKAGDNIYRPNANAPLHFEQIEETKHHKEESLQKRDLGGEYTFISNHFFYFGSSPIDISKCVQKPHIPEGICPHGLITDNAQAFISFVEKKAKKKHCIQPGIYAFPHKWENKVEETISENVDTNKTKKGCSPCG